LNSIIQHYDNYVSGIRESLQSQGVLPKDLRSHLLVISAFNHAEQKRTLLSDHEVELMKAVDLNDIFNLIAKEYASFLNYSIFQGLVDKYNIDHGQEEFKYPEYLEDFINKHTISEFSKSNPLRKKFPASSKELVLIKLNIKSTSRLAKIVKLKHAVAKILHLKSAALQLIDIKDGCVVAKFLMPTSIADVVLNRQTVLTEKQIKKLKELDILWLRCNGYEFVSDLRDAEKGEQVADYFRYPNNYYRVCIIAWLCTS